jgi:hypothetical protein
MYVITMPCNATIFIPSFMTNVPMVQKLKWGHTEAHKDSVISKAYLFSVLGRKVG